MNEKVPNRKAGGEARAKALSPEERRDIARRAAESRWMQQNQEGPIQEASYSGTVEIGNASIPCAVLPDGKRVLSDNGITNALLGSRSGASKRLRQAAKAEGAHLPLFLAPSNLKPFISNELIDGPLKPIVYRIGKRATVIGYDAELLPAVCDIWLRAREAGALQKQQLDKAQQAEILMRGLAHIGVVALIDEATGYQDIRDRVALQTILNRYLKDEWSKWTRRFPNEFYRELFRLKKINFPMPGNQKPSYVGHWTNDIVYSRLTPGLLKRLKELNPRNEHGHRARKHHQHLTDDLGVPELQQHLSNVSFLMKTCKTWDEFKERLDFAAPKFGDTMSLGLKISSPS